MKNTRPALSEGIRIKGNADFQRCQQIVPRSQRDIIFLTQETVLADNLTMFDNSKLFTTVVKIKGVDIYCDTANLDPAFICRYLNTALLCR